MKSIQNNIAKSIEPITNSVNASRVAGMDFMYLALGDSGMRTNGKYMPTYGVPLMVTGTMGIERTGDDRWRLLNLSGYQTDGIVDVPVGTQRFLTGLQAEVAQTRQSCCSKHKRFGHHLSGSLRHAFSKSLGASL